MQVVTPLLRFSVDALRKAWASGVSLGVVAAEAERPQVLLPIRAALAARPDVVKRQEVVTWLGRAEQHLGRPSTFLAPMTIALVHGEACASLNGCARTRRAALACHVAKSATSVGRTTRLATPRRWSCCPRGCDKATSGRGRAQTWLRLRALASRDPSPPNRGAPPRRA